MVKSLSRTWQTISAINIIWCILNCYVNCTTNNQIKRNCGWIGITVWSPPAGSTASTRTNCNSCAYSSISGNTVNNSIFLNASYRSVITPGKDFSYSITIKVFTYNGKVYTCLIVCRSNGDGTLNPVTHDYSASFKEATSF